MKTLNCAYCESELQMNEITRDHFKPRSRGNKAGERRSNLIYACKSCNSRKSAMSPSEFLDHLLVARNLPEEQIFVMISNLQRMIQRGPEEIGIVQREVMKYNQKLINKEKQRKAKIVA